MCAFTCFVGTAKKFASKALEDDGFVPDVVLCRHFGTTLNDDEAYIDMGCVVDGMTIKRHKRVDCTVFQYFNAAVLDVFGTHVLVSDSRRAVPLIFQDKYDVFISSNTASVHCPGRHVVMTHEETIAYGRYFVFDCV